MAADVAVVYDDGQRGTILQHLMASHAPIDTTPSSLLEGTTNKDNTDGTIETKQPLSLSSSSEPSSSSVHDGVNLTSGIAPLSSSATLPSTDTTTTTSTSSSSSSLSSASSSSDDSNPEPECRVCRLSTAPLYSPCKCRGSIKYVHQDCLTAWLVQRGGIGTSKCELCGHLFEFAPVYGDNPGNIRAHQLCGWLVRKILYYIPRVLRMIFVTSCWLILIPLVTCWLFYLFAINAADVYHLPVLQLMANHLTAYQLWLDSQYGIIICIIVVAVSVTLASLRELLREELAAAGLEDILEPDAAAPNNNNNNNNNNDHNNPNDGAPPARAPRQPLGGDAMIAAAAARAARVRQRRVVVRRIPRRGERPPVLLPAAGGAVAFTADDVALAATADASLVVPHAVPDATPPAMTNNNNNNNNNNDSITPPAVSSLSSSSSSTDQYPIISPPSPSNDLSAQRIVHHYNNDNAIDGKSVIINEQSSTIPTVIPATATTTPTTGADAAVGHVDDADDGDESDDEHDDDDHIADGDDDDMDMEGDEEGDEHDNDAVVVPPSAPRPAAVAVAVVVPPVIAPRRWADRAAREEYEFQLAMERSIADFAAQQAKQAAIDDAERKRMTLAVETKHTTAMPLPPAPAPTLSSSSSAASSSEEQKDEKAPLIDVTAPTSITLSKDHATPVPPRVADVAAAAAAVPEAAVVAPAPAVAVADAHVVPVRRRRRRVVARGGVAAAAPVDDIRAQQDAAAARQAAEELMDDMPLGHWLGFTGDLQFFGLHLLSVLVFNFLFLAGAFFVPLNLGRMAFVIISQPSASVSLHVLAAAVHSLKSVVKSNQPLDDIMAFDFDTHFPNNDTSGATIITTLANSTTAMLPIVSEPDMIISAINDTIIDTTSGSTGGGFAASVAAAATTAITSGSGAVTSSASSIASSMRLDWLPDNLSSLQSVHERFHVDMMVTLLVGYLMYATLACLFSVIGGRYQTPTTRLIRAIVRHVLIGGKVLGLIACELIGFPIVLGCFMDLLTLQLLDSSVAARQRMFTRAPITATIIHWFVGLIFMLHISFFASLLRKIIRKKVLSKFLRYPDDADFNPFRELVQLPVLTHLKRLFVSCIMYVVLVVFCVHLPAKLATKTFPSLTPLHIRLSDATEMPIDLLLFHFTVPFALEKLDLRNMSRKFVTWWFTVVTRYLSLDYYLLQTPSLARVPGAVVPAPPLQAPAVIVLAPEQILPEPNAGIIHADAADDATVARVVDTTMATPNEAAVATIPTDITETKEEKRAPPLNTIEGGPRLGWTILAHTLAAEEMAAVGIPVPSTTAHVAPGTPVLPPMAETANMGEVLQQRIMTPLPQPAAQPAVAPPVFDLLALARGLPPVAAPADIAGDHNNINHVDALPAVHADGANGGAQPNNNNGRPDPDLVPIRHFLLRVFALLIMLWCTFLVLMFTCLLLPLFAGRAILPLVRESLTHHDLYAFLVGSNLAFAIVASIVRTTAYIRAHPLRHAIMTAIQWMIIGVKCGILAIMVCGVLPLLAGMIIDLVCIIPIRFGITDTPVFHIYQDWALGLMAMKVYYKLLQTGYLGARAANQRTVLTRVLITPLPLLSFLEIWRVLVLPVLIQLLTLLLLPQLVASACIHVTRHQPSLLTIVPITPRLLDSYHTAMNRSASINNAAIIAVTHHNANISDNDMQVIATQASDDDIIAVAVEAAVTSVTDVLANTLSLVTSTSSNSNTPIEAVGHTATTDASSSSLSSSSSSSATSSTSSTHGGGIPFAYLPFVWLGPSPQRLEEYIMVRLAWIGITVIIASIWCLHMSYTLYNRLQRTAFEDRYLVGRQLINFPVATATAAAAVVPPPSSSAIPTPPAATPIAGAAAAVAPMDDAAAAPIVGVAAAAPLPPLVAAN